MMNSFFRRFLLSLSLAALLPAFGRAAALESLLSGGAPAVAPAPSAAAAVEASGKASRAGYYLDVNTADLSAVPPAPAAGSAADREDFRVLYDWQARRTAEQCAKARTEMDHSFETFFGRISPFGRPTPPQVKAFFDNVGKDSVAAHTALKQVYQRQRPFVRDPGLQPCIGRVAGLSYPSGHSAMSRLFALILSDLVPARRAEFMAKADESATLRVLGGVHHPSDTAAGKALADALYKELKRQPRFVSDLDSIKPLLR